MAAQLAQESQKKVLKEASSFSDSPLTVIMDGDEYDYFEGFDEQGNMVGYVFTTVVKGYGGEVKVMTGVDGEGKVTGVEILQMTETPGLGMNAGNESFLSQFLGKSGNIKVSTGQGDDNSVIALTGATVTSSAVTGAVNKALKLYKAVVSGGETEGGGEFAAEKALLPEAETFEEMTGTLADGSKATYTVGKNAEGEVAGYVFKTEARGFENVILVNTGINTDGLITGVRILSIEDTEGIGTQVKEEDFLNQFKGLGEGGKVESGKDAGDGRVVVISGATISSTGVVNAVNLAL
ncbi:MAG TPA: FMN-binding protein, partial [Oscillospiraceae bacterium]|nr:FMN-binding protein [Oscillospiraceae bacterium]